MRLGRCGAGASAEKLEPLAFGTAMKKTLVYIDGYNLYYGLLKGSPASKWLDLHALVNSMFKDEHEVISIKLFTARVRTYPHDAAAEERQKIYLQALAVHGGVDVIEGFYSKKKAWLPHVNEKCKACRESHAGMARVVKLEEKRSDVNLAVTALVDAVRQDVDCFVLVTGDSDQAGTIYALRREFGKTVLVFNPHVTVSEQLKRAATYYAHIPRDLPASCQLPDTIPYGKGDRFIHRPPAWA